MLTIIFFNLFIYFLPAGVKDVQVEEIYDLQKAIEG